MSDRRLVWATLAELVTRLENAAKVLVSDTPALTPRPEHSQPDVAGLEKEVRKLGRTQFKANALAEEQNAHIERVLVSLEEDREQRTELIEALVAEQLADARHAWVASLFPVLDGLDNAIMTGQRYVSKAEGHTRAQLAGWLKGVYLVRERLLAILKSEGVTPIPSVGHLFDPYLHIAVATTVDAKNGMVPGTIVAEERKGYRTDEDVLRFADVVVYRPHPKSATP